MTCNKYIITCRLDNLPAYQARNPPQPMLTHLAVRNFKRFESVEIELGSPVLFFGPNNSGKTSAMQALALWDVGLRRWNEKRAGHKTPESGLESP